MIRRGLLAGILLVLPMVAAAQGETPVRIKDGSQAGEADVVNTTPTTEYGLVVRFPSLPTGDNTIGRFKLTDGTDVALVSASGSLQVTCDNCGGSTFADEATFSVGVTTILVTGYLVDEVTPDSAPEGSAAAPRMSANRIAYSILRDAGGNERGANVDASNRLAVLADQGGAWTVTANAGTNLNTSALALDATLTGRFPAGSTPADNESNAVTTTRLGAFLFCFDGTTWDRCPGNSVDGLLVNLGANNDVTVTSGTITATQATASSLKAEVVGASSDNSANTTTKQPVIAARANAAAPTWTEGNQVPLSVDLSGSQRVAVTNTPTVTVGTFPDNEPFNLNQVAGSAVSTVATGVQKVGIVGNAGAAVDGATGAAPPANVVYVGGKTSGATGGLLTGITVCDSFVNVNVNTATTTLLVTGVSARHIRLCAMRFMVAGAQTAALISGTGATCGTGTTGMGGGTTAATGFLQAAAQGGIAYGTGVGEIDRTNATGDSVCLVTGSAVQTSARIGYTIY